MNLHERQKLRNVNRKIQVKIECKNNPHFLGSINSDKILK